MSVEPSSDNDRRMGVGRLEIALDHWCIRIVAGLAHGWQYVIRHEVFLDMQSDVLL